VFIVIVIFVFVFVFEFVFLYVMSHLLMRTEQSPAKSISLREGTV